MKRSRRAPLRRLLGCGGEIRTRDFRVMSPTSCHCSTPRAASHRGEAVILGASNRPRQADGGALLEAAASLGFDIPLDVEQALFAGLQKLGELLLEDRVRALRQLALSPAAAAVRARQDGG